MIYDWMNCTSPTLIPPLSVLWSFYLGWAIFFPISHFAKLYHFLWDSTGNERDFSTPQLCTTHHSHFPISAGQNGDLRCLIIHFPAGYDSLRWSRSSEDVLRRIRLFLWNPRSNSPSCSPLRFLCPSPSLPYHVHEESRIEKEDRATALLHAVCRNWSARCYCRCSLGLVRSQPCCVHGLIFDLCTIICFIIDR